MEGQAAPLRAGLRARVHKEPLPAATAGEKRPRSEAQQAATAAASAAAAAKRAAKAAVEAARSTSARAGRAFSRVQEALRRTFAVRREAARKLVGERKSGMAVTEQHSMLAVLGLFLYDHDGKLTIPTHGTAAARVRAGAVLSGLSEPVVRTIQRRWLFEGRIELEDTSKRGTGSDEHPLHRALPADIKERVVAFIDAELGDPDTPAWITRQSVQTFLREQMDVDASLRRVGHATGPRAAGGLRGVPGRAPVRRAAERPGVHPGGGGQLQGHLERC